MELPVEYLILFATVALVVVALLASYLILQSRRRAWEELAARLGLTFTPGNWTGSGMSITGTYHSQHLTLDTYTRRTGKNSTSYTRIVLFLQQPTQLELEITNEGMFSKIGKLLGSKEIQTGDEAIDQRYIIKGQPENMIFNLLQSYDVRQKLVEAPSLNIRARGQEIYYDKRGFIKDENNLVVLFDLMTSLANGIDRLRI
jgi:hypothetical protein